MDGLRHSLRTGHKRPVIQGPTGMGKTVLAAHIVTGSLQKRKRVAFVVPFLNLIDQTFDRFVENGISPGDMGVMQGDHPWRRPQAPIQICSAQTLLRRGFPNVDLVVADECHLRYSAIDNWMDQYPGLPFIGLSATPWAKGMGEPGRYDDLIIPTTIKELIEVGDLSPFRVFAPSHPDLSGIATVAGDYHEGQLSERMSDKRLVADVVQNWLENGEDRPTLVFAVDRAHAAVIHDGFTSMGVASEYVDGNTPREERLEIAARFQAGKTRVIVSIGTMTTGVDLDIRCIIFARPTKSEILLVQSIGRGLRTAPGKLDCLIFDHSDTTLRLGMVTDIYHDRLRTAASDEKEKAEREAKKDDGATPAKPRECPQCKCLIPVKTPQCPNCGFTPQRISTVVHAEGELVEFRAKADSKPKLKRDKMEEPAFFAQLKGFADERGYKPGWAANKFKEKYGVWPNGPHVKDVAPDFCGPQVRSWIRSRAIAFANSKNNPANQAAANDDMRELANAG